MSNDAEYRVSLREIHYEVVPEIGLRYTKRIRLCAMANGEIDFRDKVAWSAGDAGLPTSPDPLIRVEPARPDVGIWRHYRVRLARPVHRGEEVEFRLVWPALTDWYRSRPFVSTTVDHETDHVRFLIQIPAVVRNDDAATFERLDGPAAEAPEWSAAATFDRTGRLSWDVDDVRVGSHLRIGWSWSRRPARELPNQSGRLDRFSPVDVMARHSAPRGR